MPTYDEIKKAIDWMDEYGNPVENKLKTQFEKAAATVMKRYAEALKNLADR